GLDIRGQQFVEVGRRARAGVVHHGALKTLWIAIYHPGERCLRDLAEVADQLRPPVAVADDADFDCPRLRELLDDHVPCFLWSGPTARRAERARPARCATRCRDPS